MSNASCLIDRPPGRSAPVDYAFTRDELNAALRPPEGLEEEADASRIQIAKGENAHKVSSPTLLFAISNATTQAFVAGTGETNQG